jgi:hypothetical protein
MDNISPVSTERDIQLYISTRLAGTRSLFDNGHLKTLAQKSDGLFEWVRLACVYQGYEPSEPRSNRPFRSCGYRNIWKKGRSMQKCILAEVMPEDERGEAISVFRSVMGQISALLEPPFVPTSTAIIFHLGLTVTKWTGQF